MNEDKEKDIRWFVCAELAEARAWAERLNELQKINEDEIIFLRSDNDWEGTLSGIMKYRGTKYYYLSIFEEMGPKSKLNIGRCYLYFSLTDEIEKMRKVNSYERLPLNYTHPVGYFGGAMAYFLD